MKTYGVLQRGYLIWALLKAEFKKIPYKKVISSRKFLAKQKITKCGLLKLKTQNERLVNSLKKSGEIKESKKK